MRVVCVRSVSGEGQKKKQIPGGNDRKKGRGKDNGRSRFREGMTAKKGNGKGNGRSRFPEGMTERKATARAKEEADSRGNDRKKGNGKSTKILIRALFRLGFGGLGTGRPTLG
jgi:hypothetical protein